MRLFACVYCIALTNESCTPINGAMYISSKMQPILFRLCQYKNTKVKETFDDMDLDQLQVMNM